MDRTTGFLLLAVVSLLIGGCKGSSNDSGPGDGAADLLLLDGPGADGPRADGPLTDAPLTDGTAADLPTMDGTVAPPPSKWVPITAGTFTMGSPPNEPCRLSNEDLHLVKLTHGFEIWSTEVTQGQFQALMGYNPSKNTSCGSSCPVEMVRWHEAAAYCNALSSQAGLTPCYTCTGTGASITCIEVPGYNDSAFYTCPGYRLPTEAEFEYAHRAGTTTAYYSGVNDGSLCKSCTAVDANADTIAWYCANKGTQSTRPVGQKQKNAWGLYDMAGNVAEWTHDYRVLNLGTSMDTDPCRSLLTPNGRTLRGGSFSRPADQLRPAYRYFGLPNSGFTDVGFRCVRSK